MKSPYSVLDRGQSPDSLHRRVVSMRRHKEGAVWSACKDACSRLTNETALTCLKRGQSPDTVAQSKCSAEEGHYEQAAWMQLPDAPYRRYDRSW